jgi:hypothetical protein
MDQQQIIRILDEGDALRSQRRYEDAFATYERALPALIASVSKDKRSKSIGNMTGWTAGFLTGGLGLEDLILIPLVSKGVERLLGVDDRFANQAIATMCLRELDCVLNSEHLLQTVEASIVIQRFALLFATAYPMSGGERILDLYLPEMAHTTPLDAPDVIHAAYEYVLDSVRTPPLEFEEWHALLFRYLEKIGDTSELSNILRQRYGTDSAHKDRSGRSGSAGGHPHGDGAMRDRAYYCKIMGVGIDAIPDEIQKAYRDLMKKYHPDKFATCAPEFQELANRKAKEINEAYHYLMNR